ncbi:hypothetical protein DFH09DRAFT_1437511 [Mycena vulgaris]|nr:hypothetical protein DFH09DRAFT_1437511 [Mycena vulgaris]
MAVYPLPPCYSPGNASPAYSAHPKSTERTLQRSSGVGPSRISPTGFFVERNDDITLLLHDQDERAERPCIGPGKVLSGRVILERTDRENVRTVEVKIDGFLESVPLSGARSVAPVISISSSLYSSETESGCCPNSLPFSHRFPSIFSYEEAVYLLPPTCHIQFKHSQLFVKCTYRITATVLARYHMPPFIRKEQRVSVELDYHPQRVPSDPILQNPSLFATVKQCPEEWTQLPMTAADPPTSDGLVCDLFVLSARVFRISDPIPLHLQVSGPAASLREMFRRGPKAFTHALHTTGDSPIQVYILRRITMRVGDRHARRSIVLGEGTLRALPPAFHEGVDAGAQTLSWEGEARCIDAATVGGFEAGLISVKDSIGAEISPPPGSALRRAFAEYPIRLTANGWIT